MIFDCRTILAVGAIAAWFGCGGAVAETRLALVIGNSAYETVSPLPNPANDAKAMTDMLTRAGFEVTTAGDLGNSAMRKAIGDFAAKVAGAGPDNVALVFYAGHGVQVDGENFLVPVDARVQRESDLPLQAVRLTDLMNGLAAVQSKTRIVILDACRNNPFSEINKTSGHGLAIVDAPLGSIISYSTSPGSEAEDGAGANSPYTTAILGIIMQPGLPIELAFKQARMAVDRATGGRQTPWESTSLKTDFFFVPGAADGTPRPATAGDRAQAGAVKSVEIWTRELRGLAPRQAYDMVIGGDTVEAYQAFVALYDAPPFGPHVRGLLARRTEMMAWYTAVTVNSVASFQAFLASYPGSDFAATARRLMERTPNRSLGPQSAQNQQNPAASRLLASTTLACPCTVPASPQRDLQRAGPERPDGDTRRPTEERRVIRAGEIDGGPVRGRRLSDPPRRNVEIRKRGRLDEGRNPTGPRRRY